MKSAQVALWNNQKATSDKSPTLYGSVQLPAALVQELATVLPPDLYDRIERLAKAERRSLNSMINIIVDENIDHFEKWRLDAA